MTSMTGENTLISSMKANGLLGDYFSLKAVLREAIEQAESGKGKERHAEEGEPFERQIICEVARRVGLGYPLGQAVKKIYESQRLDGDAGVQELLGAINYIAAAVIVMQEEVEKEPKAEGNHPENPDSSPEFKPGDRLILTTPDGEKRSCFFICESGEADGICRVLYSDGTMDGSVPLDALELAPKAEGYESLIVLPPDAPQTKEELYSKILESNPATYGHPHKPTGEELAEMAREKEDGDASGR